MTNKNKAKMNRKKVNTDKTAPRERKYNRSESCKIEQSGDHLKDREQTRRGEEKAKRRQIKKKKYRTTTVT